MPKYLGNLWLSIRKASSQDAEAIHMAHMKSIQDVCSKDHTIEGFGHLKEGYILGLYITPKVLGKNLGKEILELMFTQTKAMKFSELSLKSTLTAHAFYQKMGFKDSGPQTRVEVSGQNIRCYPMKKLL